MSVSVSSPVSASHIAVVLPSGDSDTEGTRGLLRERLALWALWVCVLSSGFYIVNVVTWPLVAPDGAGLAFMLRHPAVLAHLAASLLFGGVWLVARRSPLSLRALRVLDAGTLVVGGTMYAVMGAAYMHLRQGPGQDPLMGLYAGLLAGTSIVTARAIAVPSTAARTLWTSTAAMVPVVAATGIARSEAGLVVNVATWCAVAVAIATVGSRVIFGLRREAARVRRLGQYTLEEKIGAGGMGVVYRASHAMLRRPTAIKLLPPERAGEANLQRFEREVQMTAQLSHPNTVAIYDYGRTPDGIFYYAMEYLDGINLEDLVRLDGPVPPGRVVAILSQVCRSLGEAHDRGLLHRDIKPANIILTERGGEPDVAKVVDFGLVKRIVPGGADATMSASIVLAGTPLYMPPEALTSPDTLDPRSDLYAVGGVGYFLLTGQPVFNATTVGEAFAHHLRSVPVPPSQRAPHPVPADLEALILRCLSKSVDERPPSARAMDGELRRGSAAASWTTQDAAAWWRRFRDTHPIAGPTVTPPASQAATVTVDVAGRV